MTNTTHLELNFLGPFEVTLDGKPVTAFASDKVRALLAYLAVEGRQPHRREALAGLLWPDYPDADALASLRQAIHKLRQALGEDGQAKQTSLPPCLLVNQQTVQLDSDSYRLDVEKFSALVDACRSHRHRKIAYCSVCHTRFLQAARLYRGDFLAGFLLQDSHAFDDWLVLKREGLRRQAVYAFEHLTKYHETRAEYEQTLRYVYRQLEMEPWREDAHRQAMKLLALDGQRGAAIVQYEACRRVLSEELGIEPEPETVALYERIKRGDWEADAGRKQGFPSADSRLSAPRLVGRDEELAKLVGLLDSPDYRLVTLIGLGGVGKTRLAQRAAAEQAGTFDDGTYFIPLAAVGKPALLASSIAQAVGLRFGPTEQPDAQLIGYLRDKEMLLVLDNFEHLIDGGTDLIVSIFNNAPKIAMLVTSRERLGLQAEYLLDLSGLPYPEAEDARWAMDNTEPPPIARRPSSAFDNLESYAAVQLFVERARQVQSQFALSKDNVSGVVDICKFVAGLPLGIVLAAAWVRHFSTARIANSIKDNLDFLASSSRDASPQHSSLRAVFTHSWKLLSTEEQQAFRKLSVFRGGWDEVAAERVAGASLHTLLSLVDKSLLRREASGRFSIHEVLRQYAAEQLEASSGERDETQARHAAYFLDLAEQAGVGEGSRVPLRGPEEDIWLDRLDVENKNLRAALEWAKRAVQVGQGQTPERDGAVGPVELQVRLVGALWRYWYLRGYYTEGREYLVEAISTSAAAGNSAVEESHLARVNHGAGVISLKQGEFAAADRYLEESLRLFQRVGDKGALGFVLISLGLVAHDHGDYDRASAMYSEGLAVGREVGDKSGVALALNNLGNVAREQGDYARAQALFEECLAIAQEIGDKRRTALSLSSMGLVAWCQGDYSSATSCVQKSLKLHHELNDRLGVSNCLEMLGRVASSQSKTDRSRAVDAAILWSGAEALREAIGSPLPPADRAEHELSVATARQALGVEAYEAAWAEGHDTPIEQILAQALRIS